MRYFMVRGRILRSGRSGDALGPCVCRGRGAKSGGLECWTSAVEAEVWRTGQLVSKRMDILVSRDFRVSKGAPRR